MGVMDKKKHKNQLFYSYNQWEDYQFGMYEEEQKGRKNRVDRAILMLSDEYMCRLFMKKVCEEWTISCKQNFTNPQMNKIAWLGQAACCLYARNIDLKRQVKFTPRKVHKTQIKDRSVFIRRIFSDFQALELDHFAEMDTVHSSQDSKRVI